jgi:MarR family transcriptional regulator for hemolysin
VRPVPTPIGLHLTQAARSVSRAFDEALARAGGSLPVWLVLLNLKIRPDASQRGLAREIGLREATLTHHLNAMEAGGLLTRRRDPANRRVHIMELTKAGEESFLRLREAASGFDRQLRRGSTDTDLDHLRGALDRLVANANARDVPRPAKARRAPSPTRR